MQRKGVLFSLFALFLCTGCSLFVSPTGNTTTKKVSEDTQNTGNDTGTLASGGHPGKR
jgi:hypothetical protein